MANVIEGGENKTTYAPFYNLASEKSHGNRIRSTAVLTEEVYLKNFFSFNLLDASEKRFVLTDNERELTLNVVGLYRELTLLTKDAQKNNDTIGQAIVDSKKHILDFMKAGDVTKESVTAFCHTMRQDLTTLEGKMPKRSSGFFKKAFAIIANIATFGLINVFSSGFTARLFKPVATPLPRKENIEKHISDINSSV